MPSTQETPIFGDALETLKDEPWLKKGQGPKTKNIPKNEIEKAAEQAGFTSREGGSSTQEVKAPITQRRYRTGRNEQLSLKVRNEDKSSFIDLCDEKEWVQGYGFQRMLEALQRELEAESKSK